MRSVEECIHKGICLNCGLPIPNYNGGIPLDGKCFCVVYPDKCR